MLHLRTAIILLVLSVPTVLPAQGWPNDQVARMLVADLSPTGEMEGGK